MPLRSVTGRPGRVDYQWFRGVTAVRAAVDETRLSDHYALIVDYEIRYVRADLKVRPYVRVVRTPERGHARVRINIGT